MKLSNRSWYIIAILFFITVNGNAVHFIPVWSGNPYNPMTIIVTQAQLSGLDLTSGDEIGIFDNTNCVGRGILVQPISPLNTGSYLFITCSRDDPGTGTIDGFTDGHTIEYRVWKQTTGIETSYVTHTFPYSPSFVSETFIQNETIVVTISAVQVPANQLVQNVVTGPGVTQCYQATQTITVAGNGTSYQASSGSDVTMVAGQKILFLPGTSLLSGAHLHGYITPNGQYCNGMVPLYPMSIEFSAPLISENESVFTLGPNPAYEKATIRQVSGRKNSRITVTVLTIAGQRLLEISGSDTTLEVDLSGLMPGLYLVGITSDGIIQYHKILKM